MLPEGLFGGKADHAGGGCGHGRDYLGDGFFLMSKLTIGVNLGKVNAQGSPHRYFQPQFQRFEQPAQLLLVLPRLSIGGVKNVGRRTWVTHGPPWQIAVGCNFNESGACDHKDALFSGGFAYF